MFTYRQGLDDSIRLMPCSAHHNVIRRVTPSDLIHNILTAALFTHRSSGFAFKQQRFHFISYPQLQPFCRFHGSLERAGHRTETVGNLDDVYLPFDRLDGATQYSGNSSPDIRGKIPVKQYEGAHISEHSNSSTISGEKVYNMHGYSTPLAGKLEAGPGPARMARIYTPGTVPHGTLPSPSTAMHSPCSVSEHRIGTACGSFPGAQSRISRRRGARPTEKRAQSSPKTFNRDRLKRPVSKRETWQVQKDAISSKFGSAGWTPRKRLSPDALEGIRALHAQFPDKFSTPVLANQFEVSVEAIRRILKSKWRPNDEEATNRRQRWDKRGERIWGQMVALGVKPPKKWREVSHGCPLPRSLHSLVLSMMFGSLGPCQQLSRF